MLGGKLSQLRTIRTSSARYRQKRVDVSGFNLQGTEGANSFNLLLDDGNNIIIESGHLYNLDTGTPILS
mgnify:CR=1 FL=1|jgi:hypothetical protein|tara:strand:- start:153 stop:359 length:207 start_codon:yes stop_codon:yes gene_type:complete